MTKFTAVAEKEKCESPTENKKRLVIQPFLFSVRLSHFSFSATTVNLVFPLGEMLNGYLLPK